MKTRKQIGRVLQAQREYNKLSLYSVGQQCGLAIPQVRCIELGSKNYTIDSLMAYCETLGYELQLVQSSASPTKT